MEKIDLVKRYLSGDYNDIQLNYWIVQNNFDKKEIRRLIEYTKSTEPFVFLCKLIMIYILFNFIFCFFYSIINFSNS